MSIRVSETVKGEFKVTLAASDRRRLHEMVKAIGPLTKLETIGRYERFDTTEWWRILVGQVAVMGGSRGLNEARKNPAFEQAISLDRCIAAKDPSRYIAGVLRSSKATRFWQKAADKIAAAATNPKVVRGGQVVLCEGLTHTMPREDVRAALVSHPALFRLKSASDFMIGVGLSHDVIAFDARVVGLLREHFGLEVTTGRVQGCRPLYFALEAALRDVCAEIGRPLALLDRVIYQFRRTPEMEEALK